MIELDPAAVLISVGAIIGIVNWAKRLGLPSKGSLILAMVLGVVLSVMEAIVYAETAIAAPLVYGALISGIGMGLAAAGVHDVGTGGASKVLKQIMEGPEDDRRVTEYIIDGKVYAGADNEMVPPGSYIREYHGDVKPERAAGDLVI